MHSPAVDLPDAPDETLTAAVVDLVLRGMWRGRPEAEYRPLADVGLAMVKGPLVLPTERA
jgi:hypothetical protein